MKNSYWLHGEQGKMASMANLSPQYFNGILHRVRGCSPEMSKRLASVAKALKKDIPWTEWLFNKTSYHPAFYNK